MPQKSIVWLASYPKSGNTWTRIFLGNYIFNPPAPMPINQINKLGMADSAANLYRAVAVGPFDPADPMQALRLRGKVLRGIVGNGADVNFLKTHNYKGEVFGTDLVPADLTRAAIHIIRDPRDVAVSYARHFGHAIEQAVGSMGRSSNTTAGGKTSVKQFLCSWSEHVTSWARAREFPVLTLRYEDIRADPHTAFAKALELIGMPLDRERLDRAVRFSSFDELRRQEDNEPFVERSENTERFFHTGTSGQWQRVMSPGLVEQIERDHGAVMREFGYLEG